MGRSRGQFFTSKKHLARQQRERLIRRYLVLGTGLVFFLVLALVGFGFFQEAVIQPRQPVAIVNGEVITTEELQKMVRFQRFQLVSQYTSILQTMQQFGADENIRSFFTSNLQQILLQLEDQTALGRGVLNTLIEDKLIRQEAIRRGITVSEDEIEATLQEAFGYFAKETPTPTDAPTAAPTSTLNPTQLALVTATPTQTPTATPEVEPTATLEPSPTPTAPPQPSPTPYTFEAFQTDFGARVDELEREIGFTEADLRELILSQLYREKLQEALTADMPREQEQVWARRVIVEDEAKAQEIYRQLIEEGDWSTVAAEFSTDISTANRGGDLGWFGRGVLPAAFENVLFTLGVGEISEPFETSSGWAIVQVLGHEMRPLAQGEYEVLRQQEFQQWLSETRLQADVQIFDYWTDRIPQDPDIPPQLRAAAQPPPQPQLEATPTP